MVRYVENEKEPEYSYYTPADGLVTNYSVNNILYRGVSCPSGDQLLGSFLGDDITYEPPYIISYPLVPVCSALKKNRKLR